MLCHSSFYRIENVADDFELEEYFEEGGVCVIEWATNIQDILPDKVLDIEIKDLGDNRRVLKISDQSDFYSRIMNEVVI